MSMTYKIDYDAWYRLIDELFPDVLPVGYPLQFWGWEQASPMLLAFSSKNLDFNEFDMD